MNSYGTIFRIQIFGESHGPVVGVTIDGCIPGLPLCETDFEEDLERRKGTGQKGTTPRKEEDRPVFLSGVFNGKTTGAPLTIIFENNNTQSTDYEKQRAIPRPGHADFVAGIKYKGHEDFRGGGHFSGRLTACLVAAGVVAKKLLSENIKVEKQGNIKCRATLIEAGGNSNIDQALDDALVAGDSIGGIVECRVSGLPIGWGEPFFDSVESKVSHLVFAIPAIKGIEFGEGFKAARMRGSEHNDALADASGNLFSNHAGGVVGGLTNGAELLFRVVVKPTSSTPRQQSSFNTQTRAVESFAVSGRHDLCIALRVPVVIEAVTNIVLADLCMIQRSRE